MQERNRAQEFEAKVFEGAGGTIPYRLLAPPDCNSQRRYPLVLFLHGAGERGSDNALQLKHVCPRFVEERIRIRYPCFVVAPQCPEESSWVDWQATIESETQTPGPAEPLRLALDVLDALRNEFHIDGGRIYVTGISMGGFGAWDAITRWPDRFAAAVPVCGGGDAAKAHRAAQVPIWAFHGAEDALVPPERSRQMVAAVRKAGGSPKYTEFEGVGHDSWTPAFAKSELFAWMFAQTRP